jgi:hypothetical protein
VLGFLSQVKAVGVTNVLSSDPSDDVLAAAKLIAPPGVHVFARDGSLAKKFDNEEAESEKEYFTYAEVGKLVDELAAKK